MTFLIIFGRRIRLHGTGVEAIEESAALQDNFPETEKPSQLPLSCFAWHPSKQIVLDYCELFSELIAIVYLSGFMLCSITVGDLPA
jgi:hypothetical protein